MKKMIAFFMTAICAMVVKYFTVDDFASFLDFEKMVVVCQQKLSEEFVQNGEDYYNVFRDKKAQNILAEWESIDAKGVNLYFSLEKDLEYFSQRVENMQQVSDIDDNCCWQGYYGGFKDFRYINKKKINFQLVQTDEGWIMGFPYIITGF